MAVVNKKKKTAKKQKPLLTRYPYTVIITLLALLLSLFVVLSQAQKSQEQRSRAQSSACDIAATDMAISAEEQRMLELINTYRTSKGVAPLTKSDNLTRNASWMSKDMSTNNRTDHKDSLNRIPEERAIACGSAYGAENIASGFTTPDATFNFWKNSSNHEFNLADPKYTVIGIGQTGTFWSVVFAQNDEVPTVSMTVAPSPTMAVPSPECLGACVTISPTAPAPTQPQVSVTIEPSVEVTPPGGTDPTVTTEPTQAPSDPETGSGGGFLQLLLDFLKMILEFFASLFK